MSRRKIILFTYFLLGTLLGFSQMTDDNQLEYANLNKDSLILEAKKQLAPIIAEKGGLIEKINFSIYKIRVMANEQSNIVQFNLPIKFLAVESSYYGNMVVDIKLRTTHIQKVSNPKNSKKAAVFYTNSHQEKEAVKFVIQALNKHEPNTIDSKTFNDEMIISDHEQYYRVIIHSPYYYSDYKIEKGTGIILEDQFEQLEPDPDDNYIEIKN